MSISENWQSKLKKEFISPLKRWLLLNTYLNTNHMRNLPDRIWFKNNLLSKLSELQSGRILFVGCAFYTYEYLKLFNKDVEMITVDYDERNEIWGSKNHITADIQNIHELIEPYSVDIVLLNGIFGHGVDSLQAQTNTYKSLHNILKPEGILLVGWNHDLSYDPLENDSCKELYVKFTYENLPQRKSFPNCTHVYDFLRTKIS